MANNLDEESSPLLGTTDTKINESDPNAPIGKVDESFLPPSPPPKQPPVPKVAQPQVAETYGWAADGLPLGVVGQPMMGRVPWNSGLFSCFGRNDEFHCDEFHSSDLEVCLLGSVAPCVLYGSNVERLGSTTGSFSNHFSSYAALYLIGNSFFGWNSLAPCLSYTSRTAVRRAFNLEGGCEALLRHLGCSGRLVEDEMQQEQLEAACDFATHVLCHPCSFCQEGREIRRRLPHPSLNAQPVLVMIPPWGQAMDRA
ncbi:LOW QUALITY PROTEIN: cell number regulator 8 [Spinacia oleracea]|uniref:LOW QUALITY PROTEIN: cell number regulator 8 n=1 Tax=Spinacia oleracea TaxID=3562 RepID=A0A9R0IFY3_SPIOL|nr:LOW QUALITY PROTEIN: cell number regulator 8 [Spinacia oleracea]